MKIAAITKFKHGELWEALTKLNWSAKRLAKEVGVSDYTIYSVLNLRRRPTRIIADRIQRALGEAGIYLDVLELWPEAFEGLESNALVQYRDVSPSQLLEEDASTKRMRQEVERLIGKAASSCRERELEALKLRVCDGWQLREIAAKLKTCHQTVDNMIKKARRKFLRTQAKEDAVLEALAIIEDHKQASGQSMFEAQLEADNVTDL